MYLHELTSIFILLQMLDYFTSAIFFSLAIFILLRNPHAPLNRASFWLLASFFVWSASLIIVHNPFISREIVSLFYDIGAIGWGSFAGLALYFAITFNGNANLNRFKNLTLIPLPIFIYLEWQGLLGRDYVLQSWGWAYRWAHSVWSYAYYVYVVVFVCAAFYIIYRLWQKGENKVIKGQASIILLTGNISLILAMITDVVLPFSNIYVVPNIAPSCILFFAIGMIYVIGRYQFAIYEKEIGTQAEREWSKIFDSISDIIYILDTDFRFISLNKAACDFFHVGPGDLIGKKCYEVVHKTGKPWKNCPFVLTLKDNQPHTEEVDDPGIGRPLLISASPLFDADGKLKGIVHIAKDLSDVKRTEAALAVSERKYRQLVDNLQEGVWVIDKDANTTFVNPHMAEMLGYTMQEMLGKPLFYFMDDQGRELANRLIERRKQGIREQHDFEFMRKDGQRMFATLETAPIVDEKGAYQGELAGVMDVTEKRRIENELSKKMNYLEKFQKLTVDRELKMKELKARIAELEAKSK
jgi:PAS domain S-box-containing protein